MDFYGHHESPIDRAFAQDPAGMQDLSNSAAPLPRKRPTAKPVTSGIKDTESPADPPSPTTATSVAGGADASTATATAVKKSPAAQSQMAINDNAAQLQQLRTQMEGSADPQQQAVLMQRMTGLMNELQSMMAHMSLMNGGGSIAATNGAPASGDMFHFGDGNMEAQSGLRSTAKPFEPNATPYTPTGSGFRGSGSGSAFGGSHNFGGGGGAGGPQRYQPVNQMANPYNAAWSTGASGGGAFASSRTHGCVICIVEFKRGRMKRYESDVFIAPGNYIIVEGDRGEDCGLVVHTFQRLPDGSTGRSETLEGVAIDMNKIKPETGRVRRVANDQEVERLHGEIATLERSALKTCRERVEHMSLDMDVVDCEYQFDCKKITFFFDAPRAIDFRELTKDLFRHFGARIWLENINSKVKNVVPEGALSHADKLLYAERGLRPPRR